MKRYVKANNKYIKDYDPTKELSYLVPVDANNLYAYAMQFKLPYRGFKWCNEEELYYLLNNILSIPDDSDIGYNLKVDLDYPKKLHDEHNDYAIFPIHKEIKHDYLSTYQKKLLKRKNYKSKKLITSLEDKKGFVCDYRTLKQSIKEGLVLKKIHSAIEYEQKAWLKPYIELNTKLRQESNSELEKDRFKLLNNAIYGKTIVNVLKRQDINFCTDKKKALRYIYQKD